MHLNLVTTYLNRWPLRLVLFALVFLQMSCRRPAEAPSREKFTVADRNSTNIALIVGSPNDLGGVARDVINVSNMIKQNDLGYQVEVINNATRSQILSKAKEISSRLSPNSTVFFYFSGHGSEDGALATQGYGSITLREVTNSLGSNVSGKKFKRFISVIDACYSGQSAVGSQAVFLSSSSKDFSIENFISSLASDSDNGLFSAGADNAGSDGAVASGRSPTFEQGLVLAAAKPSEESLDGGDSIGGVFTSSWLEAIRAGKGTTLQQILERSKQITVMNSGGSHTPVWKVMPESLLQERFDRRDNTSQGQASNNAQVPIDPGTPVTSNQHPSPNPAPPTAAPGGTVITVGSNPVPPQGPPPIATTPSNPPAGQSDDSERDIWGALLRTITGE